MADPNDLLPSEGLDNTVPVAGLDLLPPAPGAFKQGFGAGVAGVKSGFAGAGALAARAVGAKDLEAAALAKVADYNAEAAPLARRIEDVDWTSPSAVADHFKYLLGQSVPSLALMFTGGVAGRGAGAIARRAGAPAAATNVGMVTGAAAPNVALQAGGIFPEALETGVENPALRAAAGGVVGAATDFIPLLAAGRYLGAAGRGGFGAMAKGAAKGAPIGGVLEGTQELTQSVIARAAAGQDMTGPDAVSEYVNAFAGGFAPGAVIGGGVGAIHGRAAPAVPASVPEPQYTPPPPAPPPPAPPRPGTPLTPEDEADLAYANLVTAHDAATAQATALETRIAESQAQQAAATARLAELKAEEAKPLGERRPKNEIIAERRALAKQMQAAKAGLEPLGGELRQVREAIAGMAPQIAAAEQRDAARQALLQTPAGLNPAIVPKEGTDVPNTGRIETAPRTPAEQVERAVRGVHALFKEQGMILPTEPGNVDIRQPARRDAALATVAERTTPRESTRAPSPAQMQAVEPHAMAVIEPIAKQLAEAKGRTPEAQSKVQARLTRVMREVVQEAAKKPNVAEAQAHITSRLPEALKGLGVSQDAADIAKAVSAAVGQANTVYSRGAAAQADLVSIAAQVEDQFQPGEPGHARAADLQWREERVALSALDAEGVAWARREYPQERWNKAWAGDPIVLHHAADGTYYVWDGNHRVAAAARAGVKTLPAIVGRKPQANAAESNAALTQDEFDALPERGQRRVVDEYNAVMARKGTELREELRRIIGDDPNLKVTTFTAVPNRRSNRPAIPPAGVAERRDPRTFSKTVIGSYTRLSNEKSLIALALNAREELGVVHHEGWHYAEDQLMNSAERAVLRRDLAPGKPLHAKLLEAVRQYDLENRTNLADEVAGSQIEAHAYAFQFWKAGRLQTEGVVNRVFEKILQVLRAIERMVTGQGFTTIEDIFTAMDRGHYAQRQRAERGLDFPASYANAFVGPDGTPVLSRDAPATWYRSALTEQMGKLAMKSGSAQSWREQLKGLVSKGLVKQAEIDAVGLEDWLELQGEQRRGVEKDWPGGNKITRDEVLAFLGQNGVRLDEVVFGGEPAVPTATAHISDKMADYLAAYDLNWPNNPTGWNDLIERLNISASRAGGNQFEQANLQALIEEAQRHREAQRGNVELAPETRYADYQLPGGTMYREWMITLPGAGHPASDSAPRSSAMVEFLTAHGIESPRSPNEWADVAERIGMYAAQAPSEAHEQSLIALGREAEHNAAQPPQTADTGWTDGHPGYDEVRNPIVRVRGNIRTDADGKTVLFIEELQPPTKHQQGKMPEWAKIPKHYMAIGLRRMIRHAIENNVDRIAWTTGAQQVERYTGALRKRVDAIEWAKTKDGVQLVGWKGKKRWGPSDVEDVSAAVRTPAFRALEANDMLGFGTLGEALGAVLDNADWAERWQIADAVQEGAIARWRRAKLESNRADNARRVKVVDTTQTETDLSDAIGKAMADQIRSNPAQSGVIEGENITIDDTGMAGFYDRLLPSVANEVLRKLGGGKVGVVQARVGHDSAMVTYFKNRQGSPYGDEGTYNIHVESRQFKNLTLDKVRERFGDFVADAVAANTGRNPANDAWYSKDVYHYAGTIQTPAPALPQPGFSLTPELVKRALDGLPLFSRAAVAPGAVVNIGLKVGETGSITPEEAIQALRNVGVQVQVSTVRTSATEPTLVARLDRALTPPEAHALAVALNQEAIAQVAGGVGELYGPNAAAWRPFNSEFFLPLDTQFSRGAAKNAVRARVQRDSKNVDFFAGKVKVGSARLQYDIEDEDALVIGNIEATRPGSGYGAAMYRALNQIVFERTGRPLKSSSDTVSESAERVWQSLVRSGEATGGGIGPYKFRPPTPARPGTAYSRGAIADETLPAYGRAKPGAVTTPAVHFSPTAGLARIDTGRYGTGMMGAERAPVMAAKDRRLRKRLHFYVPQGYGVRSEKGVGPHAYGVTLANLYDAGTDPLRIWANAADPQAAESAVLDAGFDGYLARESSTAVLLGDHNVQVAPLGMGDAEANARLGTLSVPPAVFDTNALLAKDLVADRRLPFGQLRPAEWREIIRTQAPDLYARLPASVFEGTERVYRDQLIRAFYRNAPVDFTGDGLGHALLSLPQAGQTAYSRGAVAAEAQMDRQAAAGENQQAQLFQQTAKMMEDALAKGPDNLGKLALGALNTEVSGGLSRWWQKNIATPNFTSRLSAGYRNVFKTLNTYVRYRNDLVERMLIQRIPLWYTASTEDQDAAFAALNKRNIEGYTSSSPELRDLMSGLNDKQREMFVSATRMFEGFLRMELEADKPFYQRVYTTPGAYEQWLADRTEQVTTMIDKGYMPLRRYGDHTVHVYLDTVAEDGRPVKLSGALEFFGTARGAYAAAKIYEAEIARTGAKLKVEVGTHYKAARDTTVSAQQFLDTARRNGVPLTAAEQERLVKALSSADSLTRNRLLHREGMPGYSKDGMRVMNEFGMRMAGKLAYARFATAIDAASEGRAVESDVIQGVAQIQIDERQGEGETQETRESFNARNLWKLEGPMSGFHRNLADELTDFVLVPDHTGEWSRKLRGAAMMYFIGGSISAGVVNTMSVPMMVVPELSVHTDYANAAASALSAWTTTWRYQHILRDIERLKSNDPADAIPGIDAGLRGALVEAAQYTMDTELHQIMGISQGAMLSQNQTVQRAMKAWMAPFRVSEQTNRITAFIAAYKVASTTGVRQPDGSFRRLAGPELFRFARDMIDATQNNYNETNRPGAARNPIFALMFMFKSFPLFITEAIVLMHKQNPKSAVYMLLGLVAMTGIQGLPFAETIEDLIDTIAQRLFGSPFNTRRAMRNMIKSASEAMIGYDASELVLRGVINHVTGVSASSRIGAGDFVPGTRLGTADADAGRTLGEVLGAPFAMVKDTASNALKLAGGVATGDWKQAADALRAGGPIAVRNAIKGVEQITAGYASDAKGRKLVDVNGLEAVLQLAGLSPASLAKAYEFESINRQTKAFHTQVSANMQRNLVQALRDGDAERVQEVHDLRRAWNEQYPSMPILVNPSAVRRDLALSGLPMDRRSVLLWSRRIRGENIFAEAAP